MADVPQFSPARQDMIHHIWFEKLERWARGIYVISGGAASEKSPASMDVSIDELVTIYGTTPTNVSFSIDAAHATLARIDILYQTTAGAFAIHKGDNLAIDDPLGNYNSSTHANWEQLVSPYPKESLPAGVPLYMIFVAPGATAINDEDLCPVAALGPTPPTIIVTSAGSGTVTYGPFRVTHNGGASQALMVTPAICKIDTVVVKCVEAPGGTLTLNIGYAADTDALAGDADIPKTLNGTEFFVGAPNITSVKNLIATIGGSGTVGEWDIWFTITEYSSS